MPPVQENSCVAVATTFSGSSALAGKDDNIKRLRSMLANVEDMRRGSEPIPENVAAALRADDMSMDECAELLQSMIEDGLGEKQPRSPQPCTRP